jgi:hypothetical protein
MNKDFLRDGTQSLSDASKGGEPPSEWTTSRVLIAMGPKSGAVLEYQGSGITIEMEEAGLYGLDDLGLDDAPSGLSIWEGDYVYEPGYVDGYEAPGEGMSSPKGRFRQLTPEEWATVSEAKPLWPELAPEPAF